MPGRLTGVTRTQNHDNAARLADEVSKRRHRLGRKQDQLAAYGGPSSRAVRDIEAGRMKVFTASMLGKLDRSLAWREGTAARILAGTATREEIDAPVEHNGVAHAALGGLDGRAQAIAVDSIPSRARVGEPTLSTAPTTGELVAELLRRLAAEHSSTPAKKDAVAALSRLMPELYEAGE